MAIKHKNFLYSVILISLCLGCSFTFFTEGQDIKDNLRQILAGFGILSMFAWFVLARTSINPAKKNLLSSLLIAMMAFLLLISTNMVGAQFNQRFDVTTSQHHSLSAQSKAILKDIQEPIAIHAFFLASSGEEKNFRMLIDAFSEQTSQLTIAFHDPHKDPILARQYGVTQLAEVILKKGDQTQRLDSIFSEEVLIQSILSLSQGRHHEVCFSVGHQELLIDQYEPLSSMQNLLNKLESQNYTGKNINIMAMQAIPKSCSVLVIAGPKLDFAPFEIELLAEYIAKGKHLYALIDVGTAPLLSASFARYGIFIKDNAVLEPSPAHRISGGDLSYAVLNTTDFAVHPTAKTLSTNILMQEIRSVEIDADNRSQALVELARTSHESWAETQYLEGPIEKNPGIDILGPVSVMAISEIQEPEVIPIGKTSPSTIQDDVTAKNKDQSTRSPGAKIIVIGSSSLVIDEFTSRPDLGNLDLFLNGISWMVDETEQLHSRTRDGNVTPFLLNPQQLRLIILIALFLSPATLLFGAIATWYWKKNSGPKTAEA